MYELMVQAKSAEISSKHQDHNWNLKVGSVLLYQTESAKLLLTLSLYSTGRQTHSRLGLMLV